MEVQRESLPGPSTLASASAGSTQDDCELLRMYLNKWMQLDGGMDISLTFPNGQVLSNYLYWSSHRQLPQKGYSPY